MKTSKQIAAEIDAHLKRFEADVAVNTSRDGRMGGIKRFWHAGAFCHRQRIRVTYIGHQGSSGLTRAEAEEYLAWLDAGNVGQHYVAIDRK